MNSRNEYDANLYWITIQMQQDCLTSFNPYKSLDKVIYTTTFNITRLATKQQPPDRIHRPIAASPSSTRLPTILTNTAKILWTQLHPPSPRLPKKKERKI
jgi:ABC-type dipeptide/oligopeptide/nickel transport system ATPase subunit